MPKCIPKQIKVRQLMHVEKLCLQKKIFELWNYDEKTCMFCCMSVGIPPYITVFISHLFSIQSLNKSNRMSMTLSEQKYLVNR